MQLGRLHATVHSTDSQVSVYVHSAQPAFATITAVTADLSESRQRI